jgi:hypothetical protein
LDGKSSAQQIKSGKGAIKGKAPSNEVPFILSEICASFKWNVVERVEKAGESFGLTVGRLRRRGKDG